MRRFALIAAVMSMLSVAMVGTVVPAASAQDQTVAVLLNSGPFSWVKGEEAWMSLSWTARADMSEIEITADTTEPGVVVNYPDEGADATSLVGGDQLFSHQLSSSQLSLQIGEQTADRFDLVVTIDFTVDGTRSSEQFSLPITVIDPAQTTGFLTTSEVAINAQAATEAGWIELRYINTGDVQLDTVRATVSTDLAIEHPQGAYTGLHHDERLSAGERDVARVWIDPAQLVSGSVHELDVLTQYRTANSNDWVSETSTIILRVG